MKSPTSLDPAIVFTISVLLIPFTNTNASWKDIVMYIFNPFLLSAIGILFYIVREVSKVNNLNKSRSSSSSYSSSLVPLEKREIRIANWYLVNGVFIHYLMDGLVGGLGCIPLLRYQYEKIDTRFRDFDPTVVVVSMIELFVMTPLALLVYYGYHTRRAWRPAVEIVCATLQLMGTVVFVVTELLSGLSHVPTDWNLAFSAYHILYFWFAFVLCNILWLILPCYLILCSVRDVYHYQHHQYHHQYKGE